jgi:hypothetical protein
MRVSKRPPEVPNVPRPRTAAEFAALAEGIAQMRKLAQCAPEESTAGFIEDLADEFTQVLDFMAESEDVLTGNMPWWTERQRDPS